MNAFDELTTNFSRLPGIGKKSAIRMVNWLLKQDAVYVQKFAQNIATLQEYVNQAIDAGVEARIKASSGTPKSVKTGKSGFTLDDIRKMSQAEINARWDEISKIGRLK